MDGPFDARITLGDFDRCGMRSCARPVCAVLLTAGPGEVREPGPIKTIERLSPDTALGSYDDVVTRAKILVGDNYWIELVERKI